METNLFCSIRTGRTISEKIMEDGNVINTQDDETVSTSLASLYSERTAKLTTNGHAFAGASSSPPPEYYEHYRPAPDSSQDDKYRKRINPLRIHLGKRPFVDNSPQHYSLSKKKKPYIIRPNDNNIPTPPRVPKLIPKRVDRSKFHNVTPQPESSTIDDEMGKPVPRLVPKSQLLQYKKSKTEKQGPITDYGHMGSQAMVKFRCRKCCSMSFKTLGMLKEHQLICQAQVPEPKLNTEPSTSPDTSVSGQSKPTKKVYLCSACGTYYENCNLFLHMREAHNRHICLFCLGMFSKAEKLASHLMNKHHVKEYNYGSKEDFFSVYNGTLYLMCCVCDEICSETDDFFNHDCNKVIPKPVPVLVSRMGVKPSSVKQTKSSYEQSTNCSTSVVKERPKHVSDKKDYSETKPETTVSQSLKTTADLSDCEPINSDTSINSENSTVTNKDTTNAIDSGMDVDSGISKSDHSPVQHHAQSPQTNRSHLNGDESLEHSDGSESPTQEDADLFTEHFSPKPEATVPPVIEKERESGIKLKLSLNNANSPVIIKSTVDPTVGHHNKAQKPPSRCRRPPKRYEKEMPPESAIPPRTPTIKMTICDKADNPFIKTTIYENNQEMTLRTLLNNNLENLSKTPEHKTESTVKSTIYDNKLKLEDDNSLNRVPKLTVRVPKELLDKDSSSDYSSDSDVSDKLTMDEHNVTANVPDSAKDDIMAQSYLTNIKQSIEISNEYEQPRDDIPLVADKDIFDTSLNDENIDPEKELKTEIETENNPESTAEEPPITVDTEPELPVTELTLNKPLDKYPLKDLLKVFLTSTVYNCIYCNHARKIAVNCQNLALHMVAEHRFTATVDSITAEELMPETITAKVKVGASELSEIYINLSSYDSEEKCEDIQHDNLFECFQCYFKTGVHKDLYLHNRKMHQKTILLCVMCKGNFYSYSELLCHLCPGTYDPDFEIRFRCYLCNVDTIPSSFRLMVHLRKIHHTCDVCLEFCHNQARLSNHVWKHKLNHLCYRCGIAYRNKPDITNHLFWKHGTESVLCKRCLQKKWPHVYHFCSPPAIFICEECSLQFTKAVCLKVHKRFHSGEFPHVCTEEGCTEKFVSKKLLTKHVDNHRKKMLIEDLSEEKPVTPNLQSDIAKETIPIIDLVDDKPAEEVFRESKETKEAGTEQISKKAKKKKLKDKDALMLDVNLPELNLSESDSSDESDSGLPVPTLKDEIKHEISEDKTENKSEDIKDITDIKDEAKLDQLLVPKTDEKVEPTEDEKPNEDKVLEIWDNFKKYQEKVEPTQKPKEKTPPLVPIKKHVCESDHDYCLIPTDLNGDDDMFNSDKKKSKKSPKKKHNGLSSSSSSSSDSDSSCSCGSNCSCSSSSGSSSSSSSDSDTSDESGRENKKKLKKKLPRRLSNGSNVDVMGLAETPVLIPEKVEPPVAESDLDTDESATDEEFYDENPQRIANKLYEEKRNQLLLSSVAPSDGGSVSGEASRPMTPVKEADSVKEIAETIPEDVAAKEKPSSSKKKSKKKKKSKSSKKHGPIKINIPKQVIAKPELEVPPPQLLPNKITISLQSNTVHIPESPSTPLVASTTNLNKSTLSSDNKRASKRRRVPNKFYGYSSDEESPQTPAATLKPHQPPKLEWRKEDLPSPVTHKPKKEIPSTILSNRLYNSYSDSIRLTAPIPPEPPKILMNTESMESSDSDSSDEGGLEIYQPRYQRQAPLPPSYLNSGTSSLPYKFQRPVARQAREGESVYCYCRCPYDEVSEMIACDAEGCPIEWFHFECVGIMVPPKGKWYCPECRKNQSFSGYR